MLPRFFFLRGERPRLSAGGTDSGSEVGACARRRAGNTVSVLGGRIPFSAPRKKKPPPDGGTRQAPILGVRPPARRDGVARATEVEKRKTREVSIHRGSDGWLDRGLPRAARSAGRGS